MPLHAEATFTLDSWDEEHSETAGGATFGRARVTKTFTGDIEGTSTAVLLTVATADGPAAYTAHEWFEGSVEGRKGTFVSQHGAVSADRGVEWTVVAGSGTGELTGITGAGSITVTDDGTHEFALDYELPEG
jgi:Protein of unknown function (DUF3224)